MLSEILKTSTRQAHASLEKQLVKDIKSIDNPHGYIRLLKLMYGYYQPHEAAIDKFLNGRHLPDFDARRKSTLILQDLKSLGANTHGLTTSHEVAQPTCVASAFGVAYVLEGSTLGGRVIFEMLMKQTGGSISNGLIFFTGYGERTIPMWMVFKENLNRIKDSDEQQRTIDAANETFSKFNQWINLYDAIEL